MFNSYICQIVKNKQNLCIICQECIFSRKEHDDTKYSRQNNMDHTEMQTFWSLHTPNSNLFFYMHNIFYFRSDVLN